MRQQNDRSVRWEPPHTALRLAALGLILCTTAGCQTVHDLVAIPFDMAAHVAVETARMPYEAGKLGAQALVDAIAGAVR